MINAAPSPRHQWKLWSKNAEFNRFFFSLITARMKVYNSVSITLLLQDFHQGNTEHMQPEVVSLLRSSEQSFFHHLVASSPEALFRWGVLRATIRILAVFKSMGCRRAELSKSPRPLNGICRHRPFNLILINNHSCCQKRLPQLP